MRSSERAAARANSALQAFLPAVVAASAAVPFAGIALWAAWRAFRRPAAANLDELRMLEDERAKMYQRGNVETELEEISKTWTGEAELHTLTLFKLLKAYERVMTKVDERQSRPIHKVKQYAYTSEGQKEYLLSLTAHEQNIPFAQIFSICENRIHAIFTFLALLELLQQRKLTVQTGMGENNFWISATA
jgi:segregation and condensation protein A